MRYKITFKLPPETPLDSTLKLRSDVYTGPMQVVSREFSSGGYVHVTGVVEEEGEGHLSRLSVGRRYTARTVVSGEWRTMFVAAPFEVVERG